MFDLLEKIFEAVAIEVSPEKKMRTFYKDILNTKLTKSTFAGEEDYYKFWLLPNGDIIPILHSHEMTAIDAGVRYSELYQTGTIAGSIMANGLTISGIKTQKLTSKQISRLKNMCIEYGITSLWVYVGKHNFTVDIKSPKEAAYYLEYGKEKWESRVEDDLLEKILEVVATKVDPEKQMRDYYEDKINTKLIKSSYGGEKNWRKFWLLTNGDVIPVRHTHGTTAVDAGTSYAKLLEAGIFAGSIITNDLLLTGAKKFTIEQISRLKSFQIEYKITQLFVDAKARFEVGVKSSKELAYYLEYGKEEWESKITDDLLEKILEADAAAIRRKHRSIKRLFPDFDDKTKGVEDKGGLRFVDQDAETWKFKIHSGTQSDLWYDAYLHFKNAKQTLERFVKDRSLWVADKSKVDFRKLSKKFMNKADIQLFCSCPAFKFWGPAFILSLDKYDAHYTRKEERPPSVRNPKRYGAVCKHLDRLLKVLPFYGSTMSKWIKDFYGKDIAQWEKESQEEFMGKARAAQAAVAKRREEAPPIEEPEVEEPEEEVPEEEKPVTAELKKAELKKEEEKPEEKPEEEPEKEPEEEEPRKEKPEEEEPEVKKKPKKRKPRRPIAGAEEAPELEWTPEAGKRPEEEYF